MLHQKVARRDFIKCAAAAALAPAALTARPAAAPAASLTADPAGLTTYQLGPQIWVRLDNRLLTCYRAHPTQKYPYLYPVSGPVSGLPLTSETTLPYPHHRSLFFGCDRVNGGNYWQEDFEKGQIVSAGPRLGASGKDHVEILDECEWRKPGAAAVMKDRRRIVIRVRNPRLWHIDWEIAWQAVTDVVIQKTNHSLFSARAALDLAPTGGGRLVNAEGDSGEKATFGKKSAWCDFSGKRTAAAGEPVEGIALMDHPGNPWAPTPWFTRDYGFMSPTPLNFIEGPWTLAAGKSVTLRYRVVAHAGSAAEAGLAELWREWAQA